MSDHTTNEPTNEIPYGYCHCGCGQKTEIAGWNDTRSGWVKGEPKRYVRNHYRPMHCLTCGRGLKRDGTCTGCTSNPKIIEINDLLEKGQKRCNDCERIRPLSEFTPRYGRKSGHSSYCRECRTARHNTFLESNPDYLREYNEQHKDQKKELEKQRYQANKERHNAASADWKRRHPDKVREERRRRNRTDPSKPNAINQRRRARKLGLPDAFTADHWKAALIYWKGCCAYCGNQEGFFRNTKLSMDHFVALSRSDCPGTVPGNIIPACLSCNASRKSRDHKEWLEWKFGKAHAKRALDKIEAYFASLTKD